MLIHNFLGKSIFLMCILGSCAVRVDTVVYGQKGSAITFVCPYTSIGLKVRWHIVYNDTAIQISEGVFISNLSPIHTRVSIVGNTTAGEYNLKLSGLQESDEEVYRCKLDLAEHYFKLELLAPPSSLTLQDVTNSKILGTEGRSLTLRCTALGGKPPPLVTITADNVTTSNNQTVEYKILTLNRQHDGQMVNCNASSSTLVATANLYLYLKPLEPNFSLYPVSTEETKPLVVSCTSIGSRPKATFQWTIGLINVTPNSTTQTTITAEDTYTVTSTLRRNVDRTYHGQTITCTAVNTVATNGVQTSETLDVKFAPVITVTNATYTQKNVTRRVTCKPDGNPATYSYYRWKHKSTLGEPIRELDGEQTGVLTLPSVSEINRYQDSGEYICTAGNAITGRDGNIYQSGSGYVTVNAQPVLTSDNKDTEYGQFGNDVNIHVYVYSIPKYTLFRWYKLNTPISQDNKYTLSQAPAIVNDTFHGIEAQLDGYILTLTIQKSVVSDFNVSYRVEVSNDVGQAVEHTTFLVSASHPETPVNFTIFNAAEFSILVQWNPGYNGGQVQTFNIEYRVNGSNTWTLKQIPDTEQSGRHVHTLSGLLDDTMYEVRMYAKNKFGKSSLTETVTIKTIKAESQAPKQIGPIVGSVGGSLAAILFIIVVIWFVIFKRKKDESADSKALRSSSDSDVPDGLQHNILYQSAGSDFKPLVSTTESVKKAQKHSTSDAVYAEVQKPNAVYAAVNKTVQQKNVQDKKQKDQKKRQKKPGKKVDKAGNNSQDGEYTNDGMSLKDMGEGEYANSEEKKGQSTSHKNQQGLEYADLSFTKKIPQKGKKPVIHGVEDRTLYSEVDHTKKAPPPPQESAYEETNFKHG